MFIFRKLQNKKYPSISGWYLTIANTKELANYLDKTNKPIIEAAFLDETNAILKKKHRRNLLNQAVCNISKMINKSWIETMGHIMTQSLSKQCKLLIDGYILYVNPTMIGYTFDTKDRRYYDLLEEVESEDLIFPSNKEVRYLQWPNGIHWYAKIGNNDIYDKEGNMKWDTKEEAEKAVEEFLEKT